MRGGLLLIYYCACAALQVQEATKEEKWRKDTTRKLFEGRKQELLAAEKRAIDTEAELKKMVSLAVASNPLVPPYHACGHLTAPASAKRCSTSQSRDYADARVELLLV